MIRLLPPKWTGQKSHATHQGRRQAEFNQPAPSILQKPLSKDTVRFSGGPDDLRNSNFQRWRDILTKQIREDLKQFRSPSQYEKTSDGSGVKSSMDYIDLPRFMRSSNEGGTGQGKGGKGDQVGQVGPDGQPQPANGDQGEEGDEEGEGDKAGQGSGDNSMEQWMPQVSRFEIARLIGDGLELPNFMPRGKSNIQKIEEVWDNLSRVGTPGNVNRRKSFEQAMRREMAMLGKDFNPLNIQWRKDDLRFFNTSEKPIPKESAVIFYIMDTSGSMTDKRKKMARDANFYLSTYIQARYGEINAELRGEAASKKDFGNGVQEEFIIHDNDAEIMQSDEKGSAEYKFYTTSKGGGTSFKPALQKVEELIKTKYPLDQWNVYVFHYTDGDPSGDDEESAAIIKSLIKQGLNLYGYIQTEGSENSVFHRKLNATFGPRDKFVRTMVMNDDSSEDCKRAVQAMLGTEETRKKL